MNKEEVTALINVVEKNKAILQGKVYVVDVDENFVCLGIPQPTRCNFEISQANQIAIYATRGRLREIYDALKEYYGDKVQEKAST